LAIKAGQAADAPITGKRLKRVLASIVNQSAKQVEAKAEAIVAKETSIPKKRTKKGIGSCLAE